MYKVIKVNDVELKKVVKNWSSTSFTLKIAAIII